MGARGGTDIVLLGGRSVSFLVRRVVSHVLLIDPFVLDDDRLLLLPRVGRDVLVLDACFLHRGFMSFTDIDVDRSFDDDAGIDPDVILDRGTIRIDPDLVGVRCGFFVDGGKETASGGFS